MVPAQGVRAGRGDGWGSLSPAVLPHQLTGLWPTDPKVSGDLLGGERGSRPSRCGWVVTRTCSAKRVGAYSSGACTDCASLESEARDEHGPKTPATGL